MIRKRFKCGDTVKRIKDSWCGMHEGDETKVLKVGAGLELEGFKGTHDPDKFIKIEFKKLKIHKEER